MLINWRQRELNLKIVYYGPALSGKTTNLEQIHARTNPQRRGELVSLKTQGDRTLFFDFLQLELGKIGGLTPKIHLYTVPGQTYYEATRKLVLKDADGVVFVADSAPAQLAANVHSWQNLKAHLVSYGVQYESFPLVVQFNKQDLPNALPPATLRNVLRLNGSPVVSAVAVQNQGVSDTLKAILNQVLARVQKEMT
ncbi:MAG TPA: ADP-ribosylation factor-like protein [Anaerolineae bacterium]|nr:ADP-ribosylation factor-like protein [Anaerolineae bacterium]HQI86223.1 ADP-ribosylation factor-like protein [Anaerolineae bacterium]